MREVLKKGIQLARLQMLLAPGTLFGEGDCGLAAEEPPGKLPVGAAALALEIPLDLSPEVRERDTGVERHKTPTKYPMSYRMWRLSRAKRPIVAFDFFGIVP